MVLMYLHGFRSSPDSNKGQVMREALGEKFTFLAPDLNVSPLAVQKILLETVKDINPSQLCLAGSSLGGFYATWLAEKIGCRAILFNPATELKPEFADQAKSMHCEIIHPERYLVFLSTADEVLDWHKAQKKYSACRQILLPENTHEITDFEQCLPEIEHFAAANQ